MFRTQETVNGSQPTKKTTTKDIIQNQDPVINSNKSNMEGDVENVKTAEICDERLENENESLCSNVRRKQAKTRKTVIRRVWSYIKLTWSGVIASKGRFHPLHSYSSTHYDI